LGRRGTVNAFSIIEAPVIDSIIVNYGHPMEQPHDYFGALCSVSAKSMAPASVTFARF
jgi:hypothetical protein